MSLPTASPMPATLASTSTGPRSRRVACAAGEPAHWFSVWLVVIDDQVYVRLGPRAAGRIEKNVAAPYVGVRILGQQFERVRAEPAPDHAERVAKAMAAKYWSDLVVHHFSHPLTLRLAPEPAGDELHH